MFQGRYNNSQKHPADYAQVLNRAWAAGLQKIIITVGTLKDADEALKFAGEDGSLLTIFNYNESKCFTCRTIIHHHGLSPNEMS